MGINLLTYQLVGPKMLDIGKRQEAVDQVSKLYEHADQVMAFRNSSVIAEDMIEVSIDELNAVFEKENKSLYERYKEIVDTKCFDEAVDAIKFGVGKPEEIVDAFIALWNGTRDTNPRDYNACYFTLPTGETWQMVCAGGDSSGDKPEGEGWEILENACLMGLPQIFGVQ